MDIRVGDIYRTRGWKGTGYHGPGDGKVLIEVVSITCAKTDIVYCGPIEVKEVNGSQSGGKPTTWGLTVQGEYSHNKAYNIDFDTIQRKQETVVHLCQCAWNKHPLFCRCK